MADRLFIFFRSWRRLEIFSAMMWEWYIFFGRNCIMIGIVGFMEGSEVYEAG